MNSIIDITCGNYEDS